MVLWASVDSYTSGSVPGPCVIDDTAFWLLRQTLELTPDDAGAINSMAIVHRRVGDLEKADHGAMGGDPADHLSALIGTGYGLTPSGDDFCCAIFI